uniref:HAT C-terminal dimerisation domain-containing protein n=1 Tax=Monopterus albus TaxID=43700 RepID=A0A3Q3Q094_MONAL
MRSIPLLPEPLLWPTSKQKYKNNSIFFTSATTTQESALNASYAVALELAKAKKPLSDGELIKRCAIEMAKAFGEDNLVKNLEGISLFRRMVTRRVFDIHDHIEGKMKQVMHDCKYFFLALDESTDVTDVSQLLIFTRTIDNSFDVHEELLKGARTFLMPLIMLQEHTGALTSCQQLLRMAHPRCRGDTPDLKGSFNRTVQTALYCTVSYTRLVGLILLFDMKDKHRLILKVKCNLHLSPQEALCDRMLDFSHVMDLVTKITNLIHGGNRSLSHRRFTAFLDEVDAAYGDLQMHTDIRWKLKDTAFLCNMAFLTDITSHLNHLNTNLQGKHQTVCELYAHMTAFQRKLELFKEGFSSRFLNLTHFPACEEMRKNVPKCEELLHIEKLQNEIKHHFQTYLVLPLNIILSSLVCKRNEKGNSFWKLLPESRFPLLRDFALSMISMFGSTYICESSFSTMKHIKSKERNRLTDDTLFHLMRIGCTESDIDIQSIVHQQAKPQVSH